MTPEDILKKHAIDFQNWIRQNSYWESSTDSGVWGKDSNIERFWSLDSIYQMFIDGIKIEPMNAKQVLKQLNKINHKS